MAIITNGLLGSSRNVVGNIVTYRMKGQDIARSKAAQVANPRTIAQQTQRVRLANVVNMYKANRPWMERLAFESKPMTWSTFNAFVSANLSNSRVFLTKQEAAQGSTIVAPYRVTEGSLASIEINANSTGATIEYQTNLILGSVDPATSTVAQVTEALLASNNGLAEGMQLSLIVNYQQQVGGVYTVIPRYYEVILSLSDATPFVDRMPDEHLALVNNRLGFVVGTDENSMGFTYVLSRDVSGSRTAVSTQSLVLTNTSLYDIMTSDSQFNAAVESYGATSAPFLAAGYQSGSNSDVEIPLSILNVNGITAGGYLGSGYQNNTTLVATFNQNVGDVERVAVSMGSDVYFSGEGVSNALTYTVSGRNVTINTNAVGSSNGGIITTVAIVINGVEYNIVFTSDTPEIGE